MGLNWIAISKLTASSTYRELQLRTTEYLQYGQGIGETQQLAEDTLYNTLVSFLWDMGMPRTEAEQFCENPDNLTELAMRINSILGR